MRLLGEITESGGVRPQSEVWVTRLWENVTSYDQVAVILARGGGKQVHITFLCVCARAKLLLLLLLLPLSLTPLLLLVVVVTPCLFGLFLFLFCLVYTLVVLFCVDTRMVALCNVQDHRSPVLRLVHP